MSDSLLKRAVDTVWPKGSAWNQKPGGGMEGLLLGITDSLGTVRTALKTLTDIRDPNLTGQLDELELDFGIIPDSTLTDAVRRARLAAKMYAEKVAGTRDRMERELRSAGFDVYVYANNPTVNPLQFTSSYQTVAGGVDAFAGEPGAVAGLFTAILLVNGDSVRTVPLWLTVSGGDAAFAGEVSAVAEQNGTTDIPIEYIVPADPTTWPMIFFVGGPATFDGTGKLVTIEIAIIPAIRRSELEQTVLRLKPLHTWGVMMVEYYL